MSELRIGTSRLGVETTLANGPRQISWPSFDQIRDQVGQGFAGSDSRLIEFGNGQTNFWAGELAGALRQGMTIAGVLAEALEKEELPLSRVQQAFLLVDPSLFGDRPRFKLYVQAAQAWVGESRLAEIEEGNKIPLLPFAKEAKKVVDNIIDYKPEGYEAGRAEAWAEATSHLSAAQLEIERLRKDVAELTAYQKVMAKGAAKAARLLQDAVAARKSDSPRAPQTDEINVNQVKENMARSGKELAAKAKAMEPLWKSIVHPQDKKIVDDREVITPDQFEAKVRNMASRFSCGDDMARNLVSANFRIEEPKS